MGTPTTTVSFNNRGTPYASIKLEDGNGKPEYFEFGATSPDQRFKPLVCRTQGATDRCNDQPHQQVSHGAGRAQSVQKVQPEVPPPSRWTGAALIATVSALSMLVSCAAVQPTHPIGKVQTVEELLVKLKKACDEGLIGDNDFYAKVLGYPLQRQLRVPPKFALENPSWQQITFAEGELVGSWAGVAVRSEAKGGPVGNLTTYPPAVIFTINLGQSRALAPLAGSGSKKCVSPEQLREIWGPANYFPPDGNIPPPHGPPSRLERYKSVINGREHNADFNFGRFAPFCLWQFSVSESFSGKIK